MTLEHQQPHPSRLALDRLALGESAPALDAHAEGCADCRAHLTAVRAQLPVPQWVKEAAAPPARRLRWWPAALAAGLASVLVLALVRPGVPPTTAKGLPAVNVWVKSGERVSTWDGKSPLHSGDAVRFEAAPAGFSHLTVVAVADDGRVTTLFAARLDPAGKPTLSPAWQLDARGAQEHLAVLFTHEAVKDPQLPSLLSRRDGEVWCIHAVLPKELP